MQYYVLCICIEHGVGSVCLALYVGSAYGRDGSFSNFST